MRAARLTLLAVAPVLDLQGRFWKVRWFGPGCSCFRGDNFDGWSAGLDMRFMF